MAYLDNDGLLYFWQQIKTKFAAASHTHPAMTGASASAAGKAGFVPAPAKGQQGVFLRGDGTWASPAGTTYEPATSSANGLMSSTDKAKLDGIAEGADKSDAYTKAEVDERLNGKASLSDIEDMATFFTRSAMDASLPQVGIATPLDYANAKELMANADMFYNDGSKCANVNAMAEVISALCEQIDTNTSSISSKADSATTLSGYGITDAYTKTETYTKEEVDAAIAAAIAGINTDTFHWDAGERTADAIVWGQGLSTGKYYTNFNANTGGLANGTGGSSVDSSGNVTVNNSTYYGGIFVPFEVTAGKTYKLTCDIPFGLLSWGELNSLSTTSSSLDSPQTKPTHLVNNWSDSGGTQSFEITPTTPYIYIAFGNSDKKPVTWSNIKFVKKRG